MVRAMLGAFVRLAVEEGCAQVHLGVSTGDRSESRVAALYATLGFDGSGSFFVADLRDRKSLSRLRLPGMADLLGPDHEGP